MPRFVKFLQILIAIVVGAIVGYDMILRGIAIFQETYVITTVVLTLLLELALFVIFKLIEDD
ncbi:conserved hypothetical protein [Vibrio nigripulchritudo MADA3029]|uniref:hypothetical protein n=1 Tax=Vibrio TaxID=662 RepID=UPI00021C426A|nr:MULTISPECIES: hypothetical protein [Vibrio]EGU54745.1 hypothetical protein VINI7043_12066 [Vibrio nigripulchritudo ATCC 27043]UAB72101.1 hypothetical protein INR79_10760 [Vibrio sp. SCSIO 43132]CCN35962.1 conserved hypothetical protein [Vibrio nigripulchritudo AM115]CCN44188.1 conserved hypothetical protein [Vibrio nigripulchritudo FTn2]CCN50544.1 conserved hypothetical protein [Vibrio nigripulchritudo MADA3020]